jgi:NADPH:quinone reductase-like Zn-dependent oxidoreductase
MLVTGVSGGTGNVAAQLGVAGGASVTGLARGAFALAGVRVVNALDEQLYDRVVDTVGGDALNAAMAHLRPHAKVTFFSGPAPVTFGRGPVTVEAIYVYASPGRFDEDLATLAALVANGKLTPLIDRTLPADQANDALEALNAGGIRGKIVLVRS